MDRPETLPRTLLAGALVGVAVLGIGGRLATALAATLLGRPANLSLAGFAEAAALGIVYGAAGGAMLAALDRVASWGGRLRGPRTGLALFVLALAVGAVRGRLPELDRPAGWLTTAIAAAAFAAYGEVLARVVPRGGRRGPAAGTAGN